MRKVHISVMAALMAFLPSTGAHAQLCCTTGSSSTSAYEVGIMSVNALRLSLSHEYNRLENAYEGSRRVEDPLGRSGYVQTTWLRAHYGISQRWGVSLSIPYMFTSRTFGALGTFSASGIGDISLLIKHSLLRLDVVSGAELAVGAGVKAPTGATDSVDDGSSLSYDLQPGTGAWDAIFWGYYYRELPFSRWSGLLSAAVKTSQTSDDGLRLGDEVLYSLMVSRRMTDSSQLSLRVKGRSSMASTRNGYEIFGTGGTILFLAPSFLFSPMRTLSFEIGFDVPVYYSVTGLQQALSYRSFVDISFHIG